MIFKTVIFGLFLQALYIARKLDGNWFSMCRVSKYTTIIFGGVAWCLAGLLASDLNLSIERSYLLMAIASFAGGDIVDLLTGGLLDAIKIRLGLGENKK